jgi:hypothetical protein
MMKSLALVLVVWLGGVAQAAGFDDALAAVQRAREEGASCKGLPGKLSLATEALEHARKAPSHTVLEQAKGRLEVAKDFAATACVDPVRAKVTEALAAALTALEAAVPARAAKQGAAFGAACRGNDDCAAEHCYVDAAGAGYCSKECAAVSDCPAHWECRRPGSGAEKICIK